jgi:hypothetical protein
MKRLTAILLITAMLMATAIPAGAVPYGDTANVPAGFWTVFNRWNGRDRADDAATIRYGRELINFWLAGSGRTARAAQWGANVAAYGFPISNVYWTAYNFIMPAAARQGDYTTELWAAETAYIFLDAFRDLQIHLGRGAGDLDFSRIRLTNMLNVMNVEISLFAEMRDGTGRIAEFDALHAPRTGVFFGEPTAFGGPSGTGTVTGGAANPSATMIYIELEHRNFTSVMDYNIARMRTAGMSLEDFHLVQIAWNFTNEGATPPAILAGDFDAHIREAAQYMRDLDVPILLRIGGEMDIWSNMPDPSQFRNAFRHVVRIVRRYAENVAFAYSVNLVSNAGYDWSMFYPGAAYVDWVGISLYTSRYHMGNHNISEVQQAIWRTGDFANPVAIMGELVSMFGDSHPIFVSEGSVSLRNLSNNEDLTDWALPHMRATYSYIPMLFPEVKAMFWFNVNLGPEHHRVRHDFPASPRALQLYHELTAQPMFIRQGGAAASTVTFREVGAYSERVVMPANAVTLLTYAPFFHMQAVRIEYRLNGSWIGQADDIPYRRTFDWSDLPAGENTLQIRAFDGTRVLAEATYSVVRTGNLVGIGARAGMQMPLRVTIDGAPVAFPGGQGPVIREDRTLVPVRGVFEELGFTVDWETATSTAVLTSQTHVIRITIGSDIFYVNGAPATERLAVPAQIISERTMVPIAIPLQAVGYTVGWDNATRTVQITN